VGITKLSNFNPESGLEVNSIECQGNWCKKGWRTDISKDSMTHNAALRVTHSNWRHKLGHA